MKLNSEANSLVFETLDSPNPSTGILMGSNIAKHDKSMK